jgi:hypothetical protein
MICFTYIFVNTLHKGGDGGGGGVGGSCGGGGDDDTRLVCEGKSWISLMKRRMERMCNKY